MFSPGDVASLTIEKPAAGGRMIARADRLVVLVSGAIPGERVRARIERVGKGVAYATAVEIDDGSPDRRAMAADPLCGGCLYAHIAYPRQLELKSLIIADAFARLGRLALPAPVAVARSPEEGYRMRARLHVRGRLVGFFREGTHEVCDARQTRQLLPATGDTVDRLVTTIQAIGVDGVREIELAENADASQRAVHLAAAAPLDAGSLDRIAAIEGLTGLSSPGASRGDVHVTDTLAAGGITISLRRHVLAFFQGNRYLLTQLLSHVAAKLPSGGCALDLYAGVGLFAVAAAAIGGVRVTAVEGDPVAAADLAANAAGTNGGVVAIHASVEEFAGSDRGRRLPPGREAAVVVDPPRTGMSRAALEAVCALRAPRLVYVSCDVATLARDARRLVDWGYALREIDAFDLFPNTPHVETVAVFERA
jgi:23S rRNA (uracil1939-C5)-methyltransferase